MRELLIVFLGGGFGSVARFTLGRWIGAFHATQFPWETFVVNILACFILGLLVGLADHKQLISPAARLFWTVGFCGGFSTFSTFSNELLHLLQSGLTTTLMLYIFGSLLFCVAATYCGLFIGESI